MAYFKSIWRGLFKAVKNFLADDPLTYAASLAFYTVISLPAILLIAINLLSATYDKNEIKNDLLGQLNKYLGPSTVNQAETILENTSLDASGLIPQIIGWGVLIFSATTVFISLQNGINKIWSVKPDPKAGWLKIIIDRIMSFAMLVSIGFILVVSLVLDSILSLLQDWIILNFGLAEAIIASVANLILSIIVTSIVFAMIFKTLPDVKTQWRNVWLGGFMTSLLFHLGKYLIAYYLNTTDVGSAYGASGSLVVFLSWVYYSSVLVLFGSKFTYEYSLIRQNKISTMEHAVFVEKKIKQEDDIHVEHIK